MRTYAGSKGRDTGTAFRGVKTKLGLNDLVSWDKRELRKLEKDWQSLDKQTGRRAIRNAHKASMDVLNRKAAAAFKKLPLKPKTKRYKRGGGTLVGTTKTGRERHVKNFRDVVDKMSNWSTRSWFTPQGVVTRSWFKHREYVAYIAPLWEGGFTPAKGTKYQGTRVPAARWRYGLARQPGEERAAIERMVTALDVQLMSGRTMTPTELRNVVG